MNKTKILDLAESDHFRGDYLAWGTIHYWSLYAGMVGGALGMAFLFLFLK